MARKGKYVDAELYQPGQADQLNRNTPDVDTKRILQAEAVWYDGENISFRDVTQDVLAQEKMEFGAAEGENVAEVAGVLEDGNQALDSMYSHIPDSPFVGPGKLFTKKQKSAILEENLRRNNGVYRSDLSGIELAKPAKSRKGVVPNPNEAQVDHIKARNRGGSNSYKNAQVLSRKENREKWDR